MKQTKEEWIDSRDFLPDFIKHSESGSYFEAVLKLLNKELHEPINDPTILQSYTIDFFLPTMADYGYTVQRRSVKHFKNAKHIPLLMRDFHDAKDVFKVLATIENPIGGKEAQESLPWCDGHGFIVDFFLYDLAHSGYVLQKSQKKFDFKDMEKDIQIYKNKVSDNLASILKATKNFNEA
jgi:hypothetical protein